MPEEVGFVQSVRGTVVYLDGLPTVRAGELVASENGARGFVGALYPERVEVFLLTDAKVEPGQMFKKTGEFLEIPVGEWLLGRVVNCLGDPVDGKTRPLDSARDLKLPLDQPAVGIGGRRFIKEQFDTGIMEIDTIFPIGKGQRELILGEQRSGKTQFLLDIIANVKDGGAICIYALIGKPIVETKDVWRQVAENNLLGHTILIVSTAADPSPLTFLTPQAAMTIASYFQKKGKDVLVILDDMGVHARAYREMALVSKRPPGRESYPGDIFYQQARLLERAGCFDSKAGGGSITALPVMELVLAEFTGFIPTNLMGMTDGHLLFKAALSQQGKRPAVDPFLSVTRVGGQTQQRLQNALATKVKEILARGEQLEIVRRFGSELPLETKVILVQKQQIEELLIQKPLVKIPKELQTIFLALPFTSFFRGKEIAFVRLAKEKLLTAFVGDRELAEFAKKVFSLPDLPGLFSALDKLAPTLSTYVHT